ncbi:hypothetical protein [Clostridium pasteurianum]|uniref:Uncharacterized protein n=1 Tax=Clostridium pasteurianum BC1 TaxID=86416 RepID=R4KEC8_CLOPA|nr:hypothetical protein [Clostridium pasteurianum]AGK97975.1 hypothetical protein Clopa_3161 [Clostridium pasteurianum BC1]
MPRKVNVDVNRAKQLYEKYGTLSRAALSLDCSPTHLKKVLVNAGVEINPYKAEKWNMKSGGWNNG